MPTSEIEELRRDIQENTKEIRLNTQKSIELIAEQKATRIVDNKNREFLQKIVKHLLYDNSKKFGKILDWTIRIATVIILTFLGYKMLTCGWGFLFG